MSWFFRRLALFLIQVLMFPPFRFILRHTRFLYAEIEFRPLVYLVRLFALALVLAPMILGGLIFGQRRYYEQSSSWPQVTGQVISSSVEKGPQTGKKPSFCAVIYYAYRVGNRTYCSNQISFKMQCFETETDAQEQIQGLPANQPISVFYDPAHPEQAVLAKGFPRAGKWTALLMGVFFSCFVAFALHQIRLKHEKLMRPIRQSKALLNRLQMNRL
jgi:hypothetical protein